MGALLTAILGLMNGTTMQVDNTRVGRSVCAFPARYVCKTQDCKGPLIASICDDADDIYWYTEQFDVTPTAKNYLVSPNGKGTYSVEFSSQGSVQKVKDGLKAVLNAKSDSYEFPFFERKQIVDVVCCKAEDQPADASNPVFSCGDDQNCQFQNISNTNPFAYVEILLDFASDNTVMCEETNRSRVNSTASVAQAKKSQLFWEDLWIRFVLPPLFFFVALAVLYDYVHLFRPYLNPLMRRLSPRLLRKWQTMQNAPPLVVNDSPIHMKRPHTC